MDPRDNGAWNSDGSTPSRVESHPEAYESMVSESRRVLDHQIGFLNQMDDAALRTVRTAVIVIGIVVSVAGLAPDQPDGGLSVVSFALGGLGVASLLGSIVLGVYTFRRSDATLGPSRDFAMRYGTSGTAGSSGTTCSSMGSTSGRRKCARSSTRTRSSSSSSSRCTSWGLFFWPWQWL